MGCQNPWLLLVSSTLLAVVLTNTTTCEAVTTSGLSPLKRSLVFRSSRSLLVPEMDLFGVQSGPADASTDAGGMVYDSEHDHVVLVGTTYDELFFQSASMLTQSEPRPGVHRADCFVATVELPPLVEESMSMQNVPTTWAFDVRARTGDNTQMPLRCDLVTRLEKWSHESSEDQLVLGGTLALVTGGNSAAPIEATEAMLLQSKIRPSPMNPSASNSTSRTERVIFDLMARPFGQVPSISSSSHGAVAMVPSIPRIIIPSAITSDGDSVYLASLHRTPFISDNPQNTTAAAATKYRIDIGVSKYSGTMHVDAVAMDKVFEQKFPTDLFEIKHRDGMSEPMPPVTSSMFQDGPGLQQYKDWELEAEKEAAQQGMDQAQGYLHDYRFDGVLLTALLVSKGSSAFEDVLVIAGSAPGTMIAGGNNTGHPFFETQSALVGDWDGFVAKLNATTGTVLRPPANNNPAENQAGYSTWSYRVQSQPRHHDFVQGLCLPVHAEANDPTSTQLPVPNVAYIVGTTMGSMEAGSQGGAFVMKLDLDTMNMVWVRQIPGPQVHGLACHAVVAPIDPSMAQSNNNVPQWDEFVYVAGEVYGGQGLQVRKLPTETTLHITASHGGMDIFVAQVSASDGGITWVQQIGTSAQDRLAKNNNNDGVIENEMDQLGKTGGGGGSLLADKYGNAIVYGTTTGNLGRTKVGEGFRDLFVARLHKTDGKWSRSSASQAATSTTVLTPAPTPASLSQANSPTSASNHNNYNPNPPVQEIRYEVIVLFLVSPLILWAIIMMATSGMGSAKTTTTSPGGLAEQAPAPASPGAGQSQLFDLMPPSRPFQEQRTAIV